MAIRILVNNVNRTGPCEGLVYYFNGLPFKARIQTKDRYRGAEWEDAEIVMESDRVQK